MVYHNISDLIMWWGHSCYFRNSSEIIKDKQLNALIKEGKSTFLVQEEHYLNMSIHTSSTKHKALFISGYTHCVKPPKAKPCAPYDKIMELEHHKSLRKSEERFITGSQQCSIHYECLSFLYIVPYLFYSLDQDYCQE